MLLQLYETEKPLTYIKFENNHTEQKQCQQQKIATWLNKQTSLHGFALDQTYFKVYVRLGAGRWGEGGGWDSVRWLVTSYILLYLRNISVKNSASCHMEMQLADQTCYLIHSQNTDNGPNSPSTDPTKSDIWQPLKINFQVTGKTQPPPPPPKKKKTRTPCLCLLFSRQTPYPLGHRGTCYFSQSQQYGNSNSNNNNNNNDFISKVLFHVKHAQLRCTMPMNNIHTHARARAHVKNIWRKNNSI